MDRLETYGGDGEVAELEQAVREYVIIRSVVLTMSDLIDTGPGVGSPAALVEPYARARKDWRAAAIALKATAARIADAAIKELDTLDEIS
jgi:hypothetical protein